MILINKEDFKTLPEKEGVYFLWSNSELLYVGRSNNIKRRVKQHISPLCQEAALVNKEEIKLISFEITRSHEEAKAIENDLLYFFKTKFNGCDNWFCNSKSQWNKLTVKEKARAREIISRVKL